MVERSVMADIAEIKKVINHIKQTPNTHLGRSFGKSRLYHLIEKLKHRIFGDIYQVTYTTSEKDGTYQLFLTNIEECHIRTLLPDMFAIYGKTIKILEIKKIPNFSRIG